MGSSIRTTFAIFALLFTIINGSVVVVVAKIALFNGEGLTTGQYRESGPYRLTTQKDCNIVLYQNWNKVLWNSRTNGKGTDCCANLLTSGNLEDLDGRSGDKLFDSAKRGADGNYVLVVQGDGNVVTYPPALWSTKIA